MRKTFPLHVLAELESTRPTAAVAQADASRSRRKRPSKVTAPTPSPIATAFDRLTVALQPELDAFDLAWTG